MNSRESKFQANVIKRIDALFPGCIILKNDANYRQGIPDVLVLWRERWAALEIKSSRNAAVQPNQEHYVLLMDSMSFSSFVYPENVEKVLDELQFAFQARRPARVSQRQQVSLDKLRRSQARRGMDKFAG